MGFTDHFSKKHSSLLCHWADRAIPAITPELPLARSSEPKVQPIHSRSEGQDQTDQYGNESKLPLLPSLSLVLKLVPLQSLPTQMGDSYPVPVFLFPRLPPSRAWQLDPPPEHRVVPRRIRHHGPRADPDRLPKRPLHSLVPRLDPSTTLQTRRRRPRLQVH